MEFCLHLNVATFILRNEEKVILAKCYVVGRRNGFLLQSVDEMQMFHNNKEKDTANEEEIFFCCNIDSSYNLSLLSEVAL